MAAAILFDLTSGGRQLYQWQHLKGLIGGFFSDLQRAAATPWCAHVPGMPGAIACQLSKFHLVCGLSTAA
jgi:hypothetical protein